MTKTTEEAGPYTIILATDFHREAGFFGCYVIRDGLPVISHPLAKPFAEEYRDELNSAWLAGRSSVTAVPLSPEMVEKLINLIYTWMVDSAAEETGVTMEQFMTEIKSTPRVIKADSDLRTRLLGIRSSPGG